MIINVNPITGKLPQYSSEQAAGADLIAFIPEGICTILPRKRKLVSTGMYMEIPKGYEAQIRPRSGLALKHGITVLNSPGTIDSDYRGEIKVILINTDDIPFIVNDGDRIAQIVITPIIKVTWNLVAQLETTQRAEGGFGSTGNN